MDSKDIRNLQEAYIGVYDSDLREEQEFKSWVTELLDEGYDLSDYTWDEMYEIYNEERSPGVKEYKGGKPYSLETIVRKSNKVNPAGKKPEGETGGVGPVKPDGKDPLNTNKSDYEQFRLGRAPRTKTFRRPFGRKYDPAAIRNDDITSQMANPKPEAPRRGVIKASYESDIYDVILEYLINEGYADTNENALVIMANMSENWKQSIVEEEKPRPIEKMAKQAERKAFYHNIDHEPWSYYTDTNRQLRKMSEVGGKKVKKAAEKGRELANDVDNRLYRKYAPSSSS